MDDIRKLRENCFAVLHKQFKDHTSAGQILSAQCADGSWQDVDYADQNLSKWSLAQHLYRLRFMAAAWSDPEDKLYHSEALGDGICRGIDFWVKEKRECANWWWNDIFVPITTGQIFILGGELLEGEWLEKIMPYLLQGRFKMTGQNRIWCAEAVLLRAILTGDTALIAAARQEIMEEIVYAKKEGIKVDGSFHQHGPQLQFGNYGASYAESVSSLIAYFAGTKWALTRIEPLRHYINNGVKWVIWKDVMDISALGRHIGPDRQTRQRDMIRAAIANMIVSDPKHAAAYKKKPLGNRMFFMSDFMVHRTKNFYVSCHANSVRTYTTETYVNHDNLLGKYLSDGMIQVMRTGKEYFNITGCWDWTRLPGTTTPATPRYTREENRAHGVVVSHNETPEVSHDTYRRLNGESTFTGGVSDGKHYGAMIYTMDLDQVKAHKAVFFADNIIIALGSGISSESPYPVATTVEQSLKIGEIQSGDGWYFHNGIGYSGKNMTLFAGLRKGDWKPTCGGFNEPQPDEKDIFQLTIEHGTNFSGGSYEYAIHPVATAGDMPDRMQSYEVLENSTKLQAVKLQNGTVMAIFHKSGKLGDFYTDTPGVFIIGKKKVHAADPTQKKRIFKFTWDGIIYKVTLPRGEFAGSTVCIDK